MAEQEIDANETGIETDLIDGWTNKKQHLKGKAKSKNDYYPANSHGQQFEYPPTPANKEKNNKINKVEALFPSQMTIPTALDIDH